MAPLYQACAALACVMALGGSALAQGTGTAFSYQGVLTDAGVPVNGACDCEFRLFDALTGGGQIGPTNTLDGAGGNPPPPTLSNGLLMVKVDFGPGAFTGAERYLEIGVRCPAGVGSYQPLTPRQPICPTPYAQFAFDGPGGFALPLEATVASDQPLFNLINSQGGNGGVAIRGEAGGSVFPAVQATSTGGAPALRGFNSGSGQAVSANAAGTGDALFASAGSGRGGIMISTQGIGLVATDGVGTVPPSGLTAAAIYGGTTNAATKPAAYLERRGTVNTFLGLNPTAALVATTNNAGGPAALFLKPSGGNQAPAVFAQAIGSPAAVFQQNAVAFSGLPGFPPFAAVHVLNANSTGEGLNVQQTSTSTSTAFSASSNNTTGRVASFTAPTPGTTADTVTMTSQTSGVVLGVNHAGTTGTIARFLRSAPGTTGTGVHVEINSTGNALFVRQNGTGRAAEFDTLNDGLVPSLVRMENQNPTGTALTVINGAGDNVDGFALSVLGPTFLSGFLTAGSTEVLGSLDVAGTKNFRIDHPLDPENKTLRHFCSEGAEPLNVYSGNAVTDGHGYATVILPDYFESINRDVRYQITVVDEGDGAGFVHAKVARKVRDNRFVVRTSAPRVEFSWRVEGVRNDAWIRTHGFRAEAEKRAGERGTYLAPDLYGPGQGRGTRDAAAAGAR
jgi:hypothetical protein